MGNSVVEMMTVEIRERKEHRAATCQVLHLFMKGHFSYGANEIFRVLLPTDPNIYTGNSMELLIM